MPNIKPDFKNNMKPKSDVSIKPYTAYMALCKVEPVEEGSRMYHGFVVVGNTTSEDVGIRILFNWPSEEVIRESEYFRRYPFISFDDEKSPTGFAITFVPVEACVAQYQKKTTDAGILLPSMDINQMDNPLLKPPPRRQ